MKHINCKWIGFAMFTSLLAACTEEYDCPLVVEKPAEVTASEHLNSFDVLKSYLSESASLQLGASISPEEFAKKDIAYSTVLSNFTAIDVFSSFSPTANLAADGSYDVSAIQTVGEAAGAAGLSVWGPSLVSKQGQRADYLNGLLEPLFIPFVPEKGKTVIADFEADELGTSYDMTGNSTAVVEDDPDGKSGKVLHVGTDAENCNRSYPIIKVKLPEGRKLGDYVSLKFDMNLYAGQWGSGMIVQINGQEFGLGANADSQGARPGAGWVRGITVSLKGAFTPGFNLPGSFSDLTEFTLSVGSASGAWHCHIDNIVMDYEVAAGGKTTLLNFEDDAIGTSYPLTGNSTAIVEEDPDGKSGKVLHVGTEGTPCNQSFPEFNIKLPDGYKLGDYHKLTFDMNLYAGQWGSGMIVRINGQQIGLGANASSQGANPGAGWVRGISVDMTGATVPGFALTNEMKELTEFTFSVGSASGSWHCHMDNIELHWKQSDKIIEKTPEEKEAIITAEMEKWVGGVVGKGGEAVTSYNILSEPLSTQVDGNTFDWGAYMGETAYIRTAIEMARDTVSHPLNLFVSNSFVQGDDMAAKAEELVSLVNTIEDGSATIDGLNIKLSVCYAADASTQLANESAIKEMFAVLAATGKQVRVSDFRISVMNADGTLLPCSAVSSDLRAGAAEYCAYIMQQYSSQISADKQAGFSFAIISENPSQTYLAPWNANYNRTALYEGIVNGLN